MIKKFRPNLCSTLSALVVSDCCALALSLILAYWLRFASGGTLAASSYLTLLPSFILFPFLFAALQLYPGLFLLRHDELKRLTIATSTGYLFLTFLFFMLQHGTVYSRLLLAVAWLCSLVFVPLFRYITRKTFAKKAWWGYPLVIFSLDGYADNTIESIRNTPEKGFYVVEEVTLSRTPTQAPAHLDSSDFSGSPDSPQRSVLPLSSANDIEEALTVLHERHPSAMAYLIGCDLTSDERNKLVRFIGQYFYRLIFQVENTWVAQATLQIAEMPGDIALTMRQNLLDPRRKRMKRILDLLFCALGSFILVPLIPLLALCIKLESRGPVFFTQDRIGLNGKTIRVFKFRTMVRNAEKKLNEVLDNNAELRAQWDMEQKLTDDPRLTRFGKFLRRTSLDELPQIFNVLKGEMSLVGPRPIVESEIAKYGASYNLYKRVTPGITGLWQISGRNDLSYARRLELDRNYIYNWSVWFDIYIILRTFPTVLSGKGAY